MVKARAVASIAETIRLKRREILIGFSVPLFSLSVNRKSDVQMFTDAGGGTDAAEHEAQQPPTR